MEQARIVEMQVALRGLQQQLRRCVGHLEDGRVVMAYQVTGEMAGSILKLEEVLRSA